MLNMDRAKERLDALGRDIAAALAEAGRAREAATLIAVSKNFEAPAIRPFIAAGQRHFGENRVQEAHGKWPRLRDETPDLLLHLIGPLQSNKAKDAVRLFDVIHTLDRAKLADRLADQMALQGRRLPCFIQVNTGEEDQKAGVAPRELETLYRHAQERAGLEIAGLMCLPPQDEPPALHFGLLANLAGDLGLGSLSMGMSGDFETALRCGATHIRVGSRLFGARATPA